MRCGGVLLGCVLLLVPGPANAHEAAEGIALRSPWKSVHGKLAITGADEGTRDASEAFARLDPDRPRREYGAEVAGAWEAAPWLRFEANARLSQARYIDRDADGARVPGAAATTIGAGATFTEPASGMFTTLHAAYLGPRPLVEDDSLRAGATLLLTASAGWRVAEAWSVSAEFLYSTRADDTSVAAARLDGASLQKSSLLVRLSGAF